MLKNLPKSEKGEERKEEREPERELAPQAMPKIRDFANVIVAVKLDRCAFDALIEIFTTDVTGRDFDTELELLTMINVLTMDMMSEIDRSYIIHQFKLAKTMSPFIIWILNI
ncbi:hypothetical protein GQ457_10G020500 [Hibiscus cannabinus]